MRAPGLFLAGMLWAVPVSAEQIPVRTGDHPTFTRIVVDFTRRPEWRLGRAGAVHELRLNRADVTFDLAAAFRRISGDRLLGLRDLGSGRLEIALNCTCSIAVEPLANQGLVIDIRDGAPPRGDRFETALDPEAKAPATAPRSGRPQPGKKQILPVILPAASDGNAGLAGSGFPLAGLPDPATLERVAQTRRDLVDQTARAASQGLITFDTTRLDQLRATETAVPPPDRDSLQGVARDLVKMIEAKTGPNIRIETQIDRDQRARGGGKRRFADRACLPSDTLDVGSWADADTVVAALGGDRAALVDSRDRPDPVAFGTLARRYLYMTFGAEAAQLVREGPDGIPDAPLLLDLALVMDGKTPPEGLLTSQLECEGPGALWAMLATPVLPRGADIDRDSVVRTLSGFPPHLRQHLGPPLAERFLAQGDQDSALLIRNAMARGGVDLTPGAQMVSAELDLADGNRHRAEERLAEVATSRSDEAATAVARLIESRIAEGEAVDSALIDHASALAFEYDGTPQSHRLTGLIVEAMLHENRFDEALEHVNDAQQRGAITADQAADYRNRTLGKLTAVADDATFLRLILRDLAAGPIADPARVPVATRLAGLGMLGQAREALGTRAGIPDVNERRVLAAITLGEGKPDIAESYLAGLSDDESERLRGEVREFAARPIPPAGSESPPLEEASATDPQKPDPTGVLERNRTLLSESRAVRDTLRALLGPSGG